MKRLLLTGAIIGVVATSGIGCRGKAKEQTALKPQEFYAARSTPAQATPATTQPSEPAASVPSADAAANDSAPLSAPPSAGRSSGEGAVAAQPGQRAQVDAGEMTASLRPESGRSNGSYMIVGTVIAEANGQPIYADKVLAKVDAELSKKSDLDPQQFRQAAAIVIRNQVELEVRDELEFAAAQRHSTDDDMQLASALTTQWRQREITKAGGSLAVARRIAFERDGLDFDELVKERYRWYLVTIYYQKHVYPRAHVSANDMRRFYDRNPDLFSVKSAVQFRMIKVAYRNDAADKSRALDKAKGIHERAKRNEDFARLATEMNDDRTLAKNKGFPLLERDADGRIKGGAWLHENTLKLQSLEKAVFVLDKGEVTDIIDEGDGFYIAKLEDKIVGRVRAFEEIKVQEDIYKKLRGDQEMELRVKEQNKLLKASRWRIDEENMKTAVLMAMQKYAMWGRKEG